MVAPKVEDSTSGAVPLFTLRQPEYTRPGRTPFDARFQGVPLVIENGSFHCRAGWACEPWPSLDFLTTLMRPRHRVTGAIEVCVGAVDTVKLARLYDLSKAPPRNQFDGNVVCQFEYQELMLDYVFDRLSLTGGTVDHPVMMTECIANPQHSRVLMAELLFETYGVPALHFGTDAAFAHVANRQSQGLAASGVVVSSGNTATHVLPIVDGEPRYDACLRINLGGMHATEHLGKILALRYPQHALSLGPALLQSMKEDHCFCALDYAQQLQDMEHGGAAVRVQLPWSVTGPSPEQVAAETAAREARRAENVRRLQQMAAERRAQLVAERQAVVNYYHGVAEEYDAAPSLQEAQAVLASANLPSLAALNQATADAEAAVNNVGRRKRKKVAEPAGDAAAPSGAGEADADADAATLSTPDDGAARQGDGAGAAAAGEEAEAAYRRDPGGYVERLKQRHRLSAHRVEERRLRRLKKSGAGAHVAEDRRGVGKRERMRLLATASANPGKEDDFGARDEDWDVYRAMGRTEESDAEGEAGDEEEYERTGARLRQLGLAEYVVSMDPGLARAKADAVVVTPTAQPPGKLTDEDYQLTLSLERVRVPELLLQPRALTGLEQAGIDEAVTLVLSRLTSREREACAAGGLLLTGGNCSYPGLDIRMAASLRAWRPLGNPMPVFRSTNFQWDAWRGAALLAAAPNAFSAAYTRAAYEEAGLEYLRSKAGNLSYQLLL